MPGSQHSPSSTTTALPFFQFVLLLYSLSLAGEYTDILFMAGHAMVSYHQYFDSLWIFALIIDHDKKFL